MAKQSKTFKLGRNAETGEFMSVKDAQKDPKHTVVERIPKPGHGDTGKPKKRR